MTQLINNTYETGEGQGFQWRYNECLTEKAKSFDVWHPVVSFSKLIYKVQCYIQTLCIDIKRRKLQDAATTARTASSYMQHRQRQGYLEVLNSKLRMYLERIRSDLEEEEELGMQLGCWE
jgi:hypothetical protein